MVTIFTVVVVKANFVAATSGFPTAVGVAGLKVGDIMLSICDASGRAESSYVNDFAQIVSTNDELVQFHSVPETNYIATFLRP